MTPEWSLLDELFRGTNAVERIAAGQAVLRELISGAAGAPHTLLDRALSCAAALDRQRGLTLEPR